METRFFNVDIATHSRRGTGDGDSGPVCHNSFMEATLNSCRVFPVVANCHFNVIQPRPCIKDNGRKIWITRMGGDKGD